MCHKVLAIALSVHSFSFSATQANFLFIDNERNRLKRINNRQWIFSPPSAHKATPHTIADSHHYKHINAFFSKCQINARGKVSLSLHNRKEFVKFPSRLSPSTAVPFPFDLHICGVFTSRKSISSTLHAKCFDQQQNQRTCVWIALSDVWVPRFGWRGKNISLKLDKCFVRKSHSGKIERKTLDCETFLLFTQRFPKFPTKLSATSL